MPSCFLCYLVYNSVNHLITHIHVYHSINDTTEFVCKEPQCFRIFSSLNSFKKHQYSSHKFNTNKNNKIPFNCNFNTFHLENTSNLFIPDGVVCKYDIGFILKEMVMNLNYFTFYTLNDRVL